MKIRKCYCCKQVRHTEKRGFYNQRYRCKQCWKTYDEGGQNETASGKAKVTRICCKPLAPEHFGYCMKFRPCPDHKKGLAT